MTFAERLDVLTAESARLDQYFRTLSPEAWTRPSACTQWQVQDVVAHLVGVAEFYAATVVRGLHGETSPPAGRAPAGASTGASAAAGIAQRSIEARKRLGDQLRATFAATSDHLNHTLSGLTSEERQKPCYHPGGPSPRRISSSFGSRSSPFTNGISALRWNLRRIYHPRASPPLATISESIASGSLRWPSGPARRLPHRCGIASPLLAQVPPSPIWSSMAAPSAWRARRAASPDVTFGCDTETYILLVDGRLNLDAAMVSGRVRIEGPRHLAMAFGQWLKGI